jgi:hypothetical protein
MENLEGNLYNGTIPAFPYCTNVTYVIIAEDNLNNIITTEEMGQEYKYHVIPEFSPQLLLPILVASTLLTMLIRKRKQIHKTKFNINPKDSKAPIFLLLFWFLPLLNY